MTDDQSFCLHCGLAAPRVSAPNPGGTPVAQAGPAGNGLKANLLAALFGMLALLVIGGILFLVERRKTEPPVRTPTQTSTATPEPAPDSEETTSPPEPDPSETSEHFQIPLEELSGVWLPESGPSLDAIHLELSGDELVASLSAESATLILRAGQGDEELAGTLSSPAEGEASVTASLSKDMFELTLTVTPAEGEPSKRVLHRPYYTVGSPLNQSMKQTELFPNMVVQMVAIGEESGSLDSMLSKVADWFEQEVDDAVEALTSLLEPLIMSVLGVLIGGLVIAMYLPIFKMGQAI